MKAASPEVVLIRLAAAVSLFASLYACIDAPEFHQVDESGAETSATAGADAAVTTTVSADADAAPPVKTPPVPPTTPPGHDAGTTTSCGGKACQANQLCCDGKCKGGDKC